MRGFYKYIRKYYLNFQSSVQNCYAAKGEAVEHHEHAYFKKLDGEWKFIDGEIESGVPYVREEPKIGRNDPCPCGSGKKYKKCCGRHVEG